MEQHNKYDHSSPIISGHMNKGPLTVFTVECFVCFDSSPSVLDKYNRKNTSPAAPWRRGSAQGP